MTASAEARARAREIFNHSGNVAKDPAIARQLAKEGHGSFTPQVIGTWRRRHRWTENSPRSKQIADMSEEMRHAIQVRTPDDLDRVEQAAIRMSALADRLVALGERLADHLLEQIGNVKINSREDLEVVVRCIETVGASTSDFIKSQLGVGKTLQDLRLLRVSSAFAPDGSRNGEVLPPERKREREPDDPLSAQERVISNFAH